MSRRDGAGEVLELIRKGRAEKIGDIATAMGMARSTVALRVDRLVRKGLVVSARGESASRRGRRAVVLRFNHGGGIILSAHMGMTGARVAATDLAGTILERRSLGFSIGSGPEAVVAKLEESFRELLAVVTKNGARLMGIGIGIPSLVELFTARQPLVHAWDNFSIADRLSASFGARTLVDHDVSLMALAEQRLVWPDAEVFLCVKVGTVIGCGVVVGGHVVRGAQGMAGEIGHVQVSGKDAPCWCGNAGCLDAVAGGGVLASALGARGLPCSSAKDLATLAAAGVPEAVQAVRTAGRDIGEVLSSSINLLNPSVIGFWGYLAEAEEPLFAGLRETIYQRSLPAATRNLQLVRSHLGDDAGTIGAARMAIEEVLKEEMAEEPSAAASEPPA